MPPLHPANVFGSPGSTWAGVAAFFAVLAGSMANGFPSSQAGWITFGVSVVTGVGAIFSKA